MRKLITAELKRKTVEEFRSGERMPVVILLDNVRSAYNVGMVFRTADAFAVQRIICCGITSVPPNRDLLKTALGSTESVPWSYEKEQGPVVLRLKQEGYRIILAEQTDQSIALESFNPPFPVVLVFGNEIEGVGTELLPLADAAVEIPQFGTKHSLNIGVAAGIILWQVYRKWKGPL